MLRPSLSAFVSLVLIFFLTACSSSPPADDDVPAETPGDYQNILVEAPDDWIPDGVPDDGVLRRVLENDVSSLNWLLENEATVAELQSYIHDSFAHRHPEDPDQWIPALAERIDVNEDHTEFVVHLREGAHWHTPPVNDDDPRHQWMLEPREVTAEDAVFYFELARHPDVDTDFLTNFLEDIDDVEILDRYTFRVTWNETLHHAEATVLGGFPLPRWLFSRTREGEEIDEEDIAAEFESHWAHQYPIGAGPYEFDDISSHQFVMRRNDDYWNDLPPVALMTWERMRFWDAQFAALLADELDFLPSIGGDVLQDLLQHFDANPELAERFDYELIDHFAYRYIGWNADREPFSDRRVRQAMTLALDRHFIIDELYGGYAILQTGPYFHKHPGNAPDVEPWPHDLERAAERLDEAGWVDTTGDGVRNREIDGEVHRFEFEMISYDRGDYVHWLNNYADDLRDIGVIMHIRTASWPQMQQTMERRDFDAFTGGWALSWNIDPYQIWHSSQADLPRASNRVGFRHDEADEIIETLRTTIDDDERLDLLRQFHRIVHHEQPYTFLYAPRNAAVWNAERLRNIRFQPLRPHDLSLPWYVVEPPTEDRSLYVKPHAP